MNKTFGTGVFVIGFRKCGTTTVFDFLKNTGLYRACRIKEPQFFCLAPQLVDVQIGWYKNLFEKGSKPILDGSTLYVQSGSARDKILAQVSRPKFVVCVRDPARRMYSAYWHQRAKPGGIEKRSFEAVLESLRPGQHDLWYRESTALTAAAQKGLIDTRDLGNDYHRRHYGADFDTVGPDPLSFFRYAGESMYSRWIMPWLNRPDTHLVFFELLVRQPEEELRRLAAFLELPADTPLLLPANRNRNYDASQSFWLNRLVKAGIYEKLKRLAPDRLKAWWRNRVLPEAGKISLSEQKTVREILTEEYSFWENHFPETKRLWQ
ncbi:MAG: sulfotransferase domain-containing protein [Saprospiraceae bacterium]|nr:sulfotransferase domain-containing protein [Saprospiraceae bacterium]